MVSEVMSSLFQTFARGSKVKNAKQAGAAFFTLHFFIFHFSLFIDMVLYISSGAIAE